MADYIPFNRPISKNRPLGWFGPDDYDGGDWKVANDERELSIAAWDAERLRRIAAMGWVRRFWYMYLYPFDYIMVPE